MKNVGGFQIAFLVFAFQFFCWLATWTLMKAGFIGEHQLEVVNHAIVFTGAAAMFTFAGPLRRFSVDELTRPLPPAWGREVAFVGVAKLAIPVAITGAIVLATFLAGDPASLDRTRWPDPAEQRALWQTSEGIVRHLVFSWALGPVIEELVFRGLLYRAWERQWGGMRSLLLTSTCFAAIHPTHMASAFIGSVIYICVMRRTGTIVAPIALHMLFNVLVSWPLLGQVILGAPDGHFAQWPTWAPHFACLAFATIALPLYVWVSRRDARAPTATAP